MNKEAEVIQICVCCRADAGTRYETDLLDLVCERCNTDLRWAHARLKQSGIHECRPVLTNRLKGLGLL